ncbi:MAG: radical SAM protein [Anaerolineae bacterium]|jgi:MoaA/NifB/PqqE/SkfB family radical SAM enzyme|nr:radical SAM protein [Anaerolineae bacterium]MBT7192169.1 radical SAM protein [Anaerolineae bacterium]MBT7989510.1 radical SAM protein [Anaerolineae bacterium]
MSTYLRNFLRLKQGQSTLDPRLAIYYATTRCNLNCTYCEDFGARRNGEAVTTTLDDAKKILSIIRDGVKNLWITGGDPLLAPHLFDLMLFARQDLRFREISLITNGTLLSQHLNLLPLLDRLVISLDSVEPSALAAVSLPNEQSQSVIAAIEVAAPLQKEHDFKLILNAVITPETLSSMDALIEFCTTSHILLSISPQAVNNWPHFDLLISEEYRAFIKRVINLKKHGAPILGSNAYLKTLLNQEPYACYPTIIPRIMPDGCLIYPCLPMEKEGGEIGGRPVNLLGVSSWNEAWQRAIDRYGEAPSSCTSCFQQCYAEPSLIQSRPISWAWERLHTGIDLGTYGPG